MELAPKTRLGPYEILSPLGVGGMGVVYRAIDTRLGRQVAIKLLPEHLAQDGRSRERFEREARSLGALAHPNILAIFEFEVEDALPFVVMELLEGETLSKRIARGPLPWRDAVEIAVGVAEGLAAAHEKGIIHRDLKPDNLFLTTDGRVKILDFGIARSTVPEIIADDEQTEPKTAPGVIIGTLGYIAPEQLRGKQADSASDLFTLGCVLYEMIAGKRAFGGESGVDALAAVLRDDPPQIDERFSVPPGVEAVIARLLEKDRDRRYASARELAADLRLILTTQQTKRTTFVLTIIAIASAIIAIASVVAARRPLGPPLAASERINSIVVLPFDNINREPEAEYLSDGLSESLINSLSQFPNLRVVARTTAFRYKERKVDPEEIAQELNVEALVLGKIVSAGDRLVIQA
ncbi:MAG TPA: serine/threonine-protein kinase, partial [Thermoanaerobaculia bacterium]